MQEQRDNDSPQVVTIADDKALEQEVDDYKRNRRTQAKSLDITSKAFVPTKRASSNHKFPDQNAFQTGSVISPV